MTGNYRVAGEHATATFEGSYFAITATQDGTNVTVTLPSTGSVVAGGDIPATAASGTVTLTMNAGDVAELMSDMTTNLSDLSGSLVHADQPIQVIAGVQCTEQPEGDPACDHLESSMLPAETLGTDYVVTVPTSPGGAPVGHVVRFFGNEDGTTLTYSPSAPPGCPSTLDAAEVVECLGIITESFEVTGSQSFAVSSFQLGGSIVDPGDFPASLGDPSMSPMVATQQYLTDYIFLAPTDYTQSFIDVVSPPGTDLTLDGMPVTATATAINSSWSVTRVPLRGTAGSHVLVAPNPVGVQVVGYGAYTSYQYPAGLDLTEISPPPLK
jgi:hypothetical protein